MIVAFLVVVAAWPAFVFLDFLYVREIVRAGDADAEQTTRLGAVIAVPRTITLIVSLLVVPPIVIGVAFVPGAVLIATGTVIGLVGGAATVIATLGVIGFTVSRLSHVGAIRWMNSDSAAAPIWGGFQPSSCERPAPELHFVDGPAELDGYARAVVEQAARVRRSAVVRRVVPPAATAVAIVAWLALASDSSAVRTASVASVIVAAWILAIACADRRDVAVIVDRSPLREVRAGTGVLVALAVLLPLAIVRIPAVVRRCRDSAAQWSRVTDGLGAVGGVLRTGTLTWLCAAVATPLIAVQFVDAPLRGVASGLAATVFVVASIAMARGVPDTLASRDVQLLVLRVFGSARRARFLLDVSDRWSGAGRALCIAAPDVSIHQPNPDRLVDTLFAMQRARFVMGFGDHSDRFEVGRRAAGRRLEELPCFADTWQDAVRWNASLQSSVVLMDLRGFGPENRGCEFEIGTLVDHVPIDVAVLVVDDTTDRPAVETVVTRCWTAMDRHSPNTHRSSDAITVHRVGAQDGGAADEVVSRLAVAAAAGRAFNRERGFEYLQQVIASLRVLAAGVDAQLAAFAHRPDAPQLVLDEALTFDRDLDPGPSYLRAHDIIDDSQAEALEFVTQAWEELAVSGDEVLTPSAMRDRSTWHDLRTRAEAAVGALAEPE